jgi:hypothetical protein
MANITTDNAIDLHIRRIDGERDGYAVSFPISESGEYTFVFRFDGKEYPFERHCKYVLHSDPRLPYTFPNMEFAESPPGLRVGPWPGWRGIPQFPETAFSIGTNTLPIEYQLWGDELTLRSIRGVVRSAIRVDDPITLHVGDPRLIPVEGRAYPGSILRFRSLHVDLKPEVLGVHPRLLCSPAFVEELRRDAQGTRRRSWDKLIGLLENWSVPFTKTPESKTVPGPELLSAEDRVMISAMLSLVEPTVHNVARARDAYVAYLELTRQPDFEPLKIDTQSGETLFVLCVGYDWLHSHLTNAERGDAESWLGQVSDICWAHLGYERRDYAQAHYLGCGLGLLAYSFLFWETHPRAQEWACHLAGVLQTVRSLLPDDGFYPHGVNLWIYEYGFLLRWLELVRMCTGCDLWESSDHWRNTSRFRGAAASPDGLYGVTFGDPQFRVGGDSWCHYLIAERTGSEAARELGDRLSDLPHQGVDFRSMCARRRVYEFLYCGDILRRESSERQVQIFTDGGQVFLRSTSSPGTLFTFRSGAPLGMHRYQAGIHGGYGHSDPSNGSFLLFEGDGFVVSGPGPSYRRETALHNTITIDGAGQVGDTAVWLPDFFPPEQLPATAEFRTDGSRVLIAAEFALAYLPYLRAKTCRRSMFVNQDLSIFGVDVVECTVEHPVAWNLHSWYAFEREDGSDSASFITGEGPNRRRIVLLHPRANVTWETGLTEMIPAYPHDGRRDYYLRASTTGQRTRFVWWIGPARCGFPRPAAPGSADFEWIVDPEVKIRLDGKWLGPESFADET